jgi:hypothetical protein
MWNDCIFEHCSRDHSLRNVGVWLFQVARICFWGEELGALLTGSERGESGLVRDWLLWGLLRRSVTERLKFEKPDLDLEPARFREKLLS